MTLPVWCKCGNIVTFSNETRCPDCWASDQEIYHGKSKHVSVSHLSASQEAAMQRRSAVVAQLFNRGGKDAGNAKAVTTDPRR